MRWLGDALRLQSHIFHWLDYHDDHKIMENVDVVNGQMGKENKRKNLCGNMLLFQLCWITTPTIFWSTTTCAYVTKGKQFFFPEVKQMVSWSGACVVESTLTSYDASFTSNKAALKSLYQLTWTFFSNEFQFHLCVSGGVGRTWTSWGFCATKARFTEPGGAG